MAILLLTLSILFEIMAVVISLRLIPLSRSRISWILISTAFTLRAIRLTYQLALTVYSSLDYPLILLDESLGLSVSILTALGVYKIGPLFLAFRKAEDARDTYIHTISHDLRNPLTVIRGHAEIMRQGMKGKPEGPDGNLKAILNGTDRIEGLLDDLLDAARWDGGKLKIHQEAVVLSFFLRNLIETSFTGDERKRIRLECTDNMGVIQAEPERMNRIIMNLLTNALKYSPERTPVICRVMRRRQMAIISVSNEGEGIHPEELPHIFERYYRSGNTSGKEGLGLGLFITRILVEAHGGRIWAESSLGHGSTFYVALPLSYRPGQMENIDVSNPHI